MTPEEMFDLLTPEQKAFVNSKIEELYQKAQREAANKHD